MRKLIVLAMLVLSTIACTERPIPSSELDMRGTVIYERGADEPYTGLVTDSYPGGQKKLEFAVVDGLPESSEGSETEREAYGLATEWYENGQKSHEMNWDTRESIRWDQDGNRL